MVSFISNGLNSILTTFNQMSPATKVVVAVLPLLFATAARIRGTKTNASGQNPLITRKVSLIRRSHNPIKNRSLKLAIVISVIFACAVLKSLIPSQIKA